jgi:acyl carrier protein
MSDDIRQFVRDTVIRLSDSADDVSGETVLGASGLDLDSMSIAELAVLAEGEYGVDLAGEELAGLAEMTIDEFVADVVRRLGARAPERSG